MTTYNVRIERPAFIAKDFVIESSTADDAVDIATMMFDDELDDADMYVHVNETNYNVCEC